jgi:tetratricopeptide (TPR) repeat protein
MDRASPQAGSQATAPDTLGRAKQLHQAGRLTEAKQAYEAVLAVNPCHSEALYLLALIVYHEGAPDRAIELVRAAIRLQPAFPSAHRALAQIWAARGDFDQAIESCREGLRHLPDHIELEGDLANALMNKGQFDKAVVLYRKVLARAPDLAEMHNNLGIALDREGQLGQALQSFRDALAVRPTYAEAHCNLANTLANAGRHADAADAYRKAIDLKPDLAEAYSNLGNSLLELGLPQDAIIACRQAVSLNPRLASAHGNLGIALAFVGNDTEARQAYKAAVALAPGRVRYRYHLGVLTRYTPDSPELGALVELEKDASLPPGDRTLLHFALGKACDDVGRFDDAWRHFAAANQLHRRSLAYDREAEARRFAGIQRQFSADFIRRHERLGNPSPLPVFIIGMPRSGSTLVEQIISGHPRVFGAGELDDFGRSIRDIEASDGGYPESVAALPTQAYADLGTRYINRIGRLAPDAGRITDKMPHNFLYAGLIHLALPNAPIIHIIRDSRDTCLSCFSKKFTNGHLYSYDLADLGSYYCQYLSLMAHWDRVLPRGRILEVRYECLVQDIEAEARRMIAYCGLDWDPACLVPWRNRRPVFTASHAQIRQPVSDRSIGRWRNYEPFLGPLLRELDFRGPGSSADREN